MLQEHLINRTSQLLRHVKRLLGVNLISEKILRPLGLDKIPIATAQILAPIADGTAPDYLTHVAIRIQGHCQRIS